MNWDDLRFVLAVGRSGTLAGAARELAVDPTTVGRRVLAIEADLESRLFERTRDGYAPTHTGTLVLAQAEEVERATMALRHQVAGSDRRVEGPVRITALDALFDVLIIPRVGRLMRRHPGLELTFSSNLDVIDLSRHEADIAIRSQRPNHPDAVGRHLGRAALGAYAARGARLGSGPPLVGLPRDRDGTGYARLIASKFPDGTIVARGNTEGHILSLVRAGAGVGLVDCFVGDGDPSLGRFLPEPVGHTEIWAEAHVDMARAPRMRAVLDFLTEVFEDCADLVAGRCAGPPLA